MIFDKMIQLGYKPTFESKSSRLEIEWKDRNLVMESITQAGWVRAHEKNKLYINPKCKWIVLEPQHMQGGSGAQLCLYPRDEGKGGFYFLDYSTLYLMSLSSLDLKLLLRLLYWPASPYWEKWWNMTMKDYLELSPQSKEHYFSTLNHGEYKD